jgi:ElaB/YqjD/DUF883 family membrane-anchored ribosome-binding protein
MSNPSENDFVEDEPLASAANAAQNAEGQQRGLRRAAHQASVMAGETWEQTKEKAGMARDRTEYFMRENPVPTIVGALAVGLAIGWALRYATDRDEEEVEIESPLGNFNWSYLSLPFLWPFLKTVKEKYEGSAESVKEGVDRLKDIDVRRYTKPIRKRWKAWR